MQDEIETLSAAAALVKDDLMRKFLIRALEALREIFVFRQGWQVEDEDTMYAAIERFEHAYEHLLKSGKTNDQSEDLFYALSSLSRTATLSSPAYSEADVLEEIRALLHASLSTEPGAGPLHTGFMRPTLAH